LRGVLAEHRERVASDHLVERLAMRERRSCGVRAPPRLGVRPAVARESQQVRKLLGGAPGIALHCGLDAEHGRHDATPRATTLYPCPTRSRFPLSCCRVTAALALVPPRFAPSRWTRSSPPTPAFWAPLTARRRSRIWWATCAACLPSCTRFPTA